MIFHLLDFQVLKAICYFHSWFRHIPSQLPQFKIPQPEQEKSFSFLEILTGRKKKKKDKNPSDVLLRKLQCFLSNFVLLAYSPSNHKTYFPSFHSKTQC